MAKAQATPSRESSEFNPHDLIDKAGKIPSFHFEWREPGKKKNEKRPPKRQKKRRQLSIPNQSMIALQKLFRVHLEAAIDRMGDGNNGSENFTLRRLPSSTGCVLGSNHFKNSASHASKRFFYITDFKDAYPSVDLRRLTILLVFIFKFEEYKNDYGIRYFGRNELAHYAMETDPSFSQWLSFVKFTFGGFGGYGLAVGGPLSPILLNLYCEVYLDSRIRQYCEKLEDRQRPEREILYTRYVDDLVFSSNTIISSERRREFRGLIADAGFRVNHRKSFVLDKEKGAIFVTKVGLEKRDGATALVFPKKKRLRLEGVIRSSLCEPFQIDRPEVVTGLAAEFLHYYALVTTDPKDRSRRIRPNPTDRRTYLLCKKFEKVYGPYLARMQYAREDRKLVEEEVHQQNKNLKRVLKARSAQAR